MFVEVCEKQFTLTLMTREDWGVVTDSTLYWSVAQH